MFYTLEISYFEDQENGKSTLLKSLSRITPLDNDKRALCFILSKSHIL